MAKTKVIEITGVKLDPHADYLVVVDLMRVFPSGAEAALQTLNTLTKEMEAITGKQIAVLPVLGKPTDVVEVFQIAKEITINQEIKPNPILDDVPF